MRMDDFEGQYAHGFSIALDRVFLLRWIKRAQRSRVSHRFGHTSILQDGARAF
jgi:hypothetical protein